MSEPDDPLERPEPSAYLASRGKLAPKELAQYAGQWLAWNREGSRILAHGPDLDAVIAQLEAAGVGYRDVMWEQVPPSAV